MMDPLLLRMKDLLLVMKDLLLVMKDPLLVMKDPLLVMKDPLLVMKDPRPKTTAGHVIQIAKERPVDLTVAAAPADQDVKKAPSATQMDNALVYLPARKANNVDQTRAVATHAGTATTFPERPATNKLNPVTAFQTALTRKPTKPNSAATMAAAVFAASALETPQTVASVTVSRLHVSLPAILSKNVASTHVVSRPAVVVMTTLCAWVPPASASRIVPVRSAVQTVAAASVASAQTALATMNAKTGNVSVTQPAPQARNVVSIHAVELLAAAAQRRPPTATTTYANRTHVCPIVMVNPAAATAVAEAAEAVPAKTSVQLTDNASVNQPAAARSVAMMVVAETAAPALETMRARMVSASVFQTALRHQAPVEATGAVEAVVPAPSVTVAAAGHANVPVPAHLSSVATHMVRSS